MAGMGPLVAFALTINTLLSGVCGAQYLGKFIGKLSELHHGVSGEVYAVDGRTLYLKDFTYDGQGPAAYFYASTSKGANSAGFRLRDENGNPEVIRRYRKEGITLTLPEGKTLNNIKIFYVWCEEFEVNFGDVKIPRNFDYPRPQKIEALKGVHAISSDNIVIVDAQTLLIPNLSYDGEAPDAKFWVGRGPKPSPQGIRVPDENGKEIPLRRYDRKTVVLTLPGDLTVFDIGHFGIWCEAFTVDFGHVEIPKNLNVPPSLKMLGVSPQSKLNCEVLYDDLAFEVRWAVAGDSIVLQLVAKLDEREYMSFGVSGDDTKSEMIGGDVVVAWVDKDTLKGYAEDYYLGAKSQCSGPTGSCPDKRLADNSNNIRLLNAAMVNGYSIVTYQRPLRPSDEFDRQIHTNKTQAIIWAIGPLNQRNEVSFHSHYTKGDQFLNFGRPAKWNCPMPEGDQPPMRAAPVKQTTTTAAPTTTTIASRNRNNERRRGSSSNRNSNRQQEVANTADNEKSATASRSRQSERRGNTRRGNTNSVKTVPTPAPVVKRNAWDIPAIQCYEPEDGVFYAQMGPTGGKRGYSAITGHVGWGISWYINGLLIPEINVVRGKTYTFVVEGGFDPEVAAKYHPFYITDDPVGGYEYKTDEEKKNIRIFAGAITAKDGSVKPTGTGRLCHWTQQGDLEADDFESFGAYQRTLELKCDQGEPGVIQWTPDKDTPDTVYYQCFTHRYLGWKINVHDSCEQSSASEVEEVRVPAPSPSDLEDSASVIVETRVKPNDLIIIEDSDDKDTSTVSEKSTDPPITESPQGQPQKQFIEPIVVEQPQHNYFNPLPALKPQILYPYSLENPFNKNSFRPSPAIIEDGYENAMGTHQSTTIAPISISSSTISSTSTTSSSTTTTTNATSTITTSKPEMILNIGERIITAASDVKPSPIFHVPPPQNKLSYTIRRPMPSKYRPMTRPMFTYAPNKMQMQLYRPSIKMPRPPPKIYVPMQNQNQFLVYPKRQPPAPINFVILKPQPATVPPSPTAVQNVEISQQQASTEKDPKFEATSSPLVTIVPVKERFVLNLRPALNTGFRPESVVIEGGFKPIMSKEIQKRVSEDEPELEYKSEVGVIIPSNQSQQPQKFEPMFVPSPIDKESRNKQKRVKKPYIKKIIIKHERSLGDAGEHSEIEPIAEAAERVESYYLPPLGHRPKINPIKQKSNIDLESPTQIDIDSPPDVVVTYDGKKVSGASLTARLADRSSSILDMRASKAAELIKARPQFAPYKGDLPPLNPGFIIKNVPQLQARGLISRDLDTPPVGSTKLSPVRQVVEEDKDVDGSRRRKREAHHTPEHTAEQEKLKNNGNNQTSDYNNNSTAGRGSAKQINGHKIMIFVFVVASFLRFFKCY